MANFVLITEMSALFMIKFIEIIRECIGTHAPPLVLKLLFSLKT